MFCYTRKSVAHKRRESLQESTVEVAELEEAERQVPQLFCICYQNVDVVREGKKQKMNTHFCEEANRDFLSFSNCVSKSFRSSRAQLLISDPNHKCTTL
jgi:hypothetical protein